MHPHCKLIANAIYSWEKWRQMGYFIKPVGPQPLPSSQYVSGVKSGVGCGFEI